MKIEVRCCCQPQKLLGWLSVPDDVRRGTIVRFVVSHAGWRLPSISAPPSFEPMDTISLPVEDFVTYVDGLPVRSIALKSEETPLERLRLIRDFVENYDA